VNQLCANFKKSYSTVSGYARACRAFPAAKRDAALPFTVYREIGNANFGDDKTNAKKQAAMLEVAKAEGLSSTEVRNRVRNEQGKDDKSVLPHRYFVLNLENYRNSDVKRSSPEKPEAHHFIIDRQDMSWFDAAQGEWVRFAKEQ
jgi:hypothetical protein